MSFKENETLGLYLRCWLLPSLGFWMVLEALWGFYNPLSLPTQESEAMKHLWMKIDFISKEWYWIVLQSGVATINFLQSGHTWDQLRLSALIQVPALTRCLLRGSQLYLECDGCQLASPTRICLLFWVFSNICHCMCLAYSSETWLCFYYLHLCWCLSYFTELFIFCFDLALNPFHTASAPVHLQWWFTPLWITLYRCTCTKKIFNAIFVYMWSFKYL